MSPSLTAHDGALSWYAAVDSDLAYHMRDTEYDTKLPKFVFEKITIILRCVCCWVDVWMSTQLVAKHSID